MSKKDKAAKAEKRAGTVEKQASVKHKEKSGKSKAKAQAKPVAVLSEKTTVTAPAVPEEMGSGKARMDEREVMLISKALADPTRMSVLRSVAGGKGKCSAMLEGLGISPATLSHHMRELETAGLIATARDGRFLSASLQRKVWKSYLGELKSLLD